MRKITSKDTVEDIIFKMSEGNPGAITAILEIFTKSPEIDPDAALAGLAPVLSFDTWEIYGPAIYVLWNDKCDRDIRRLLILIRSVQLGVFPVNRLKSMSADHAYKINLSDEEWALLDQKVCQQIPRFARPAAVKDSLTPQK